MKNNLHKQMLAESIIASVQKQGGRFLKRHEDIRGAWVELTVDEAIIKTTQALREIPSGTSSRALNVERMLEKKRQRNQDHHIGDDSSESTYKNIVTLENTACDDHDDVFETAPIQEINTVTCDPAICFMRGFCGLNKPESCHGSLTDEELDSFMSDNDVYQALISLLE
jgi:hypothetical protein